MSVTALVRVGGSLRAPVGLELRRQVEDLLRRGQRALVIDLAHVADLDAAGIGELAHLYREALAADAALRLANAGERVRRLLDRAGLLELLSQDPAARRSALEPGRRLRGHRTAPARVTMTRQCNKEGGTP